MADDAETLPTYMSGFARSQDGLSSYVRTAMAWNAGDAISPTKRLAQMTDDDDAFYETYRKALLTISPLSQMVLNAHFDVERALDRFIERVFHHPEHVKNFRFFDKVRVIRACSPIGDEAPDWQVITKLNELRNETAHQKNRQALTRKLNALAAALRSIDRGQIKKDLVGADEEKVIAYAGLVGSGFVATIEEAILRAQGRWTDEMDYE